MAARRHAWLLSLLVGAAVGWLLVGAIGLPFAIPPFSHEACVRGGAVTTEQEGTPFGVFNAPYDGAAWMHAIFHYPWHYAAGIGWNIPNSTVDYEVFDLVNWTLFSDQTEVVPGSAPNTPCASVWQAIPVGPDNPGGGAGPIPPLENATPSDVAAPYVLYNSTYWELHGWPVSASFDLNFTGANSAPVNTCGGPPTTLHEFSTSIRLGLSFTWGSNHAFVSVELPDLLWLNYTFPGNAGVWQVDNLNLGPDAPGTGLAFVFSPCGT